MPDLQKTERTLFVFLSLAIGAYLVVRAYSINLLDDEGQTLRFYMQNCRPFLWQKGYFFAPNNHFLNTFISLIIVKLLGPAVFVVRIANLICFPLFCVYLYRYGKLLQNRVARWGLWISLLGAHYLIEFFAYSRGYAIGNTFLLVAIYTLYRWWKTSNPKTLAWSCLFICLSVSANLNLLWCALMFTLFVGIVVTTKKAKRPKATYALLIAVSAVLAFFILYAFSLKAKDQLYVGILDFHGSLLSLLPILTHLSDEHSSVYLLLLLPLPLIIPPVLYKWWKQKEANLGVLYASLLLLNLGAPILMHLLLDTKMPAERTILHWYLLFTLAFFFCLDYLKPKWLLLLALPFLAIPIRSLSQINLNRASSPLWAEEFVSPQMFSTIDSLYRNTTPPPTIATNLGSYKHIFDFEAYTRNGNAAVLNFSDTPLTMADYQVANLKDSTKYKEQYNILLKDSISGTAVLKRKDFLQREHLMRLNSPAHETDAQFYRLFRVHQDSIPEGILLFTCALQIKANDCFDGVLAVQGKNDEKPTAFWWQSSLGAVSEKWTGNNTLTVSMLLEKFPRESEYLDVYLWNIANDDYALKKATLQIDLLY